MIKVIDKTTHMPYICNTNKQIKHTTMKHTVEIKENGNTVATYEDCSKKEAIGYAKKESKESNQVFISGYNGQCTVYLNPNGNYEPTGKSW